MDLEQALFVESPLTLALAITTPVAIAAAAAFGCGKKREPSNKQVRRRAPKGVPGKSKSKRGTGSKRSSVASSKSGSKSRKSKCGSVKSSKSGKSRSGRSAKRSSKGAKDKSRKSKNKSKRSSDVSSKSKKSKRDKSLKEQSTQKSSGSTAAYIDADKKAARLAHSAALAATQNDKSLTIQQPQQQSNQDNEQNSIKTTQRSDCIQQKPTQGSNETNVPNIIGISNDATHEIKMEPGELRWSAAGGLQKISIMNQTPDRQAIKVKCSDNNVYRVNPVFAFIEPGQTLNVDVMRQNGTNKVDKIVFMTAKASTEEQNPRNIFKPGIQGSMMVLPLLATQPASVPVAAN